MSPDALPGPHRRACRVLRERRDILAVIAIGGAMGSIARWGLGEALPHGSASFAWSTLIENVSGALLLGVLMVLVLDVWSTTRYVRPFFGVGVLGGYTTFSTYMLDARGLLAAGRFGPALAYLGTTLVAGMVAAWVGIALGRLLIQGGLRAAAARRRRRETPVPSPHPSTDEQNTSTRSES
jgi:fluoride exporter